MPLDYDLDHHVLFRLSRIELQLERLLSMSADLQAKIDALQSDVEAEDTEIDSAITLMNGLSAQLSAALAAASAAGATETQLAALTDLDQTLKSKTTVLANAIASNTPAANPPAPPADTTTGGQGSDTVTGTTGDDSVSGA